MRKTPTLFVTLILSLLSLQASAADEFPTTGMVYNTKEDSSITYSCTRTQSVLLECEFVQTSVRKNAKAEDWEKKLEEAKQQFPDAVKELTSEKSCGPMSALLSVLEGKSSPEKAIEDAPEGLIRDKKQFIKGLKDISQSKKQDFLVNIRALDEFCKTKSEASFLKIGKLQH